MRILPLILLFFVVSCSKGHTIRTTSTKTELKLCFLGDTGKGNDIQKRVARELDKEKCDSIHFLGDLIYPKGLSGLNDPELKTKFLDIYSPLTAKDKNPKLYVLMGNHDYRGFITPWLELSSQNPNVVFPYPYYLVIDQKLCMVYLDTNLMKLVSEWGNGMEQVSWMGSIEEELKNCKLRIALSHHPYKSRGTHHGPATGLVKWFLELYVLGHFDYLISGHDHILSDEGEVEKTRLLISGAGAEPDKGEAPGYLVMKVDLQFYTATYEFKTAPL